MTPNDPDGMDELEELEELDELDELEPATPKAPAAKPARAGGAKSGAKSGGRPKSSRDMGPKKLEVGQKRELEQAPLELRKAAQVLLWGSLLPFLYGVNVSATAVKDSSSGFMEWVKGAPGKFPFLLFVGSKAIVLLGCWVFHEGYQATHGGKHKSPIASLAKAHKMVTPVLASLIWIAAIAWCFTASGPTFHAQTDLGGNFEETMGNARLVVELMSLILAGATITHIFAYEHGGKFNPSFPLMFCGPAIAGLVTLLAIPQVLASESKPIGMLGIVGSIIVAIGGGMACKTMMDSMKQAKVAGQIRQQAIRDERKRQREERS
tara:strand:+ start:1572 stop:2537 length:966 start_codon:yes stop_codon:yes gene_type:complete